MLLSVLCIPESYWCTPINPDGREMACGYEYADKGVRFIVDLLQIFGVCAFIITAWHAVQRRLSTTGLCGLAASVLLAGMMAFVKLRFGAGDSP